MPNHNKGCEWLAVTLNQKQKDVKHNTGFCMYLPHLYIVFRFILFILVVVRNCN